MVTGKVRHERMHIMQKTYCDFMDEITKDELYEGLLAHGFFPEKIPPVFTSIPFFDYCKSLAVPFLDERDEYVSIRIMRNIGVPRQMGIPTPMRYQRQCAVLRDNWSRIQQHFHMQTDGQNHRISRIHVRKEHGSKRVFEMNYKNWRVDGNPESDLLIHDNGVSRYLVKADISTCFPSIYTHSIPWALVGKKVAKQTAGDDTLWYNQIDKACQAVKNGETHGLLIGPHTSNLLSEIILTVVDKQLYEKGYRFIRNIDDYDCYVRSHDQADCFLRDLEDALREFDLPLNHKKTKIIVLPTGIEKNWKHELSDIPRVGESGQVEYPQVNTYIDTALRLATEANDNAIINYSIKKLAGIKLSDNAKKLASKRFIHMAALHPYLLHLMEQYVFLPYSVSKDEIKKLSDSIYNDAKRINDYESICYAIYYALRYDFDLDELDTKYIIKQKDCITLVLARLYYLKANHWKRDASQVKPYNRLARELIGTDMNRYWLFCYEALTMGSLPSEWKTMKQAGVSFIIPEFMGKDQAT